MHLSPEIDCSSYSYAPSKYYFSIYFLLSFQGSALSPGETVQHFHVDQNYHRVKKTGFPFEPRLSRPKRLENVPSSQKFLVRAKRLDIMEAAKEANMARAKRLAKLVHDGSSGRLLIRSKRRDFIQPVTNKHQLARVKRLSFTDHHGNHHGKLESRQTEKHHESHHETKRHHDGRANIHKKENRNGRTELHAKKSMHLKKGSHDGESHSKIGNHHEKKQNRYNKNDSHSKKDLHAVPHEKKESRHLERNKKYIGHKEKKEKKRAIHKTGGGYYNKRISGGHGVSHSGHENNLRSSHVSHNKWKKTAKKYATMANKLTYPKKNKRQTLKQ